MRNGALSTTSPPACTLHPGPHAAPLPAYIANAARKQLTGALTDNGSGMAEMSWKNKVRAHMRQFGLEGSFTGTIVYVSQAYLD